MGEQTSLGKFIGGEGIFYIGTINQIMQGGELMVKRFQRSSQFIFFLINPDLDY